MNAGKRLTAAAMAVAASAVSGQEIIHEGDGSYASYTPWIKARYADKSRWGDQSRFMQSRKLYMTAHPGEPIPTNDWWTDALVNRWTGNLWPYPALVRMSAVGVSVAFPSYWIENGTEMKAKSRLVFGAENFSPASADVDSWHDFDVEFVMRDGEKSIRTTLVHGSPFVWLEYEGVEPVVKAEDDGGDNKPTTTRPGGELEIGKDCAVKVGNDWYGLWSGRTEKGSWVTVGLLPRKEDFERFGKYAAAIMRASKVEWEYDEAKATVKTVFKVKTEDLRGKEKNPVALQGFEPHHLKKSRPLFKTMEGVVYETPRGKQRLAIGNRLEIDYDFPGMLPYWGVPNGELKMENGKWKMAGGEGKGESGRLRELTAKYAEKGEFGGDTYWGGKGLLQMAMAMMCARELGDEESFRTAHDKLRAKFEDWLTWEPGEEKFYFSYVPRWGGLVGEATSYDSETFNDHHFHYGYFTYSGALLCMVDEDFKTKFGGMLKLIAKDYANWERKDKRFPFLRTFDPWAGHSFAGGIGDGNGNGQESSSEAMQGWGGLYLLGLALNDREMRDTGIFGWTVEARGTAEYWFDRDRENIDYTKYTKPYNSNLTCHGVGWWTYFSGDPVWMHSIQWLPNTPALDYLSEDLKFAKWDYETMWKTKEISGWEKELGDASLGNVVLSYLQRSDPEAAARIFDRLAAENRGVYRNVDTAHLTCWAIESHLKWGELDWSVKADYPAARAFVKNGKRTLMVYNAGAEEREVKFFDREGSVVGTVKAKPGALTISGGRTTRINRFFDFSIDRLGGAAGVRQQEGEMRIVAEKTVLKEGEEAKFRCEKLGAGGRWREVRAKFMVGERDAKTGNVSVTAEAEGTKVTKIFPMEESLKVMAIDVESPGGKSNGKSNAGGAAIEVIVGEPVMIRPTATDQFGGRMSMKGAKIELSDRKNSSFTREGFIAKKPGVYTLKFTLGGRSTSVVFNARALGDVNLARLAKLTASGEENAGTKVENAADGDMKTRWGSAHRDGEWIKLDLGRERRLNTLKIEWETARATHYIIEVSSDGENWKKVFEDADVKTSHSEAPLGGSKARYLRLTGLKRNTNYGISIFELELK